MKRRSRLAHALATWFGCGFVPKAPGTAGTLGAIPLYLVLRPHGPAAVLAGAAVVGAVGVWAATVVARDLEEHDPQIVCIDEVAGVLVTLAAAPPTTAGLVLGVALFRLLDIVKPWPVSAAERLPGGYGIMLDDVTAGLVGASVIALLRLLA